MPEVKFKHVVSCNSEEKGYPADNVLSGEPKKIWKCTPGEKSAVVVIQLEKSCQIRKIDIGNDNSAFVEVLVGKESERSDEYQVLLPASAFMSPGESRLVQNGGSVRMFGLDKLSGTVAEQKWDRVKIVCSQPFNKSIGYGISFIRMEEAGGDKEELTEGNLVEENKEKEKKTLSFGKFKMKVDDEEDDVPGSMFAKRNEKRDDFIPSLEKSSSTPSAIRAASKAQDAIGMRFAKASSSAVKASPYFPKTTSSSSKADGRKDQNSQPEVKKQKLCTSSTRDTQKPGTSSSKSDEPKGRKVVKKVRFDQLLEGVVFALSGFQNPLRGEIREQGLEMGAKYRPDWGKECTHLICAFANTPKYNQVKGEGNIVKKEWLADCYKQKKKISWRKYAFEKKDVDGSDSEDEERIVGEPGDQGKKEEKKDKIVGSSTVENVSETEKTGSVETKDIKPSNASSTEKSVYDMSTDEGPSSGEGSGDTDDEIERVKAKQKAKKQRKNDQEDSSKSETSSAETTVRKSPKKLDVGPDGLPILPNFFSGYRFLLYGDFGSEEKRALRRFIMAYDGMVEEYMGDPVSHVVTHSDWDRNFEDARKENGKLVFVRPKWINECTRLNRLVDINEYLISKF